MRPKLIKRSLSALLLLCLASSCGPSTRTPLPAPNPGVLPPALVVAPDQVVPKGTLNPNGPKYKVALLLPLSGDSASIGNTMLDAANMALYDSYLSAQANQIHSQVILIPKDTGTTNSETVASTQQALEEGARLIIGPLFSQSVTAIAPMVQDHHIDMITFSNNRAVAEKGIYVFGFLPEQQIARISEFAYLHGLTRIAVLAPNDAYGQKVKDTLTELYSKKGGTVAPAELYAPSAANIDAAVTRLVATYRNLAEDHRFQGIFIADGGNQLKNILASLKKSGLDLSKIRLLGTGLWDDPEVAKIPEMQGAWFPSSLPNAYDAFEKRFVTLYGYKPVRLASLAYDAVSLVAELSMKSPDGLNEADLTNPAGYNSPANGMMRLTPDGISERPLAVLEITQGGFKVISQPPPTF